MENLCYVAGVNRIGEDGNDVAHSGGTAIYDFKGDTLAKLDDNQSGIIIQHIEKSPLEDFRRTFPAHLDADQFQLL